MYAKGFQRSMKETSGVTDEGGITRNDNCLVQ